MSVTYIKPSRIGETDIGGRERGTFATLPTGLGVGARSNSKLDGTSKASNASGSTLRPCHKFPRQAREGYVYSTPLSTQTGYIGHASSQETLRDKRRSSSQSFHDTHAEHGG
jgi:hypothetical protein